MGRDCSSNLIFSLRILIEISLSSFSVSSCTILVLAESSSRFRKSILDFSGLTGFVLAFLLLFTGTAFGVGLKGGADTFSEALDVEETGPTKEALGAKVGSVGEYLWAVVTFVRVTIGGTSVKLGVEEADGVAAELESERGLFDGLVEGDLEVGADNAAEWFGGVDALAGADVANASEGEEENGISGTMDKSVNAGSEPLTVGPWEGVDPVAGKPGCLLAGHVDVC